MRPPAQIGDYAAPTAKTALNAEFLYNKMVSSAPSEILAQTPSSMLQHTSNNSTSHLKCDPLPRLDTAHEGRGPYSDQKDPSRRKSELLPLSQVLSFQKSNTTGLIIRTADFHPEPVHPRAHLSTQELIEFYLLRLKSHTLWLEEFTAREAGSPACSEFPNLDSSQREGDNREPIPREEREFYCTSREPAEFEYGPEEKECPESCYELSVTHMAHRWKDDYVRSNQNVDDWFGGVDLLLPEESDVVRAKGGLGRRLGRTRAKLAGFGRGLGKKYKSALEGNALS